MNRLLTSRWIVAVGVLLVSLAAVWFLATALFLPAITAGLIVGFVSAAWFLIQHRPRQWWRIEAINASALALGMAILFGRSLVLLVITWPPRPPQSVGQAVFSIGLLAVVDVGLVVNLLLYRRFRRGDERRGSAQAKHLMDLLQKITDLELIVARCGELLRDRDAENADLRRQIEALGGPATPHPTPES